MPTQGNISRNWRHAAWDVAGLCVMVQRWPLRLHIDQGICPTPSLLLGSPTAMATINSREEIAQVKYLQWQELYKREKPFQVFAEVPENSTERLSNLVFVDSPPLVIRDIRGKEEQFSLDQNGFMVRRYEVPSFEQVTEQDVRKNILPFFDKMIEQEIDDVDFFYCFDWAVCHFHSILQTYQSDMPGVSC